MDRARMDRRRAAELLGVAPDARPAEVAAAFTRAARRAHPDSGGDDAAFLEVTEARDALLSSGADGVDASAAPGTADAPRRVYLGPESTPPRPQGPVLIGAWIALLAVAGFLTVYGVPHPLAPWEPLARWLLVAGGAVGFALTGARWALAVGVAAYLASLATALFVTTIGGLVGLLIAIPALYGLTLAGLARRRLVRLARASHRRPVPTTADPTTAEPHPPAN